MRTATGVTRRDSGATCARDDRCGVQASDEGGEADRRRLARLEDIHTARKRAKRLRYAAEMLGGALPAKDIKSTVSHMKRLQDDLGQFQDSEVQLHLVP